jgi:hypothetical protein
MPDPCPHITRLDVIASMLKDGVSPLCSECFPDAED